MAIHEFSLLIFIILKVVFYVISLYVSYTFIKFYDDNVNHSVRIIINKVGAFMLMLNLILFVETFITL